MHFRELEKYKQKYPQLGDKLHEFDEYLNELAHRGGRQEIVPPLVARRLSVDEGLALSLLMLAEEAGLIEHRYQVYCSGSENFLADYKNLEEIPSEVFCPYHDRMHKTPDYYVELVFFFTKQALTRHLETLA